MKFAAILALPVFIAAAHAQTGDRFELRLDQKGAARLAAVANLTRGGTAVAAGRETLDLLADREAQETFKRLRARAEIEIDGEVDGLEVDGAAENRKILVHRMDFDEADNVEPDAGEERALRRLERGDMRLTDDAERRIIFIRGAGADEAAKFIDSLAGFEDDEKAAMKDAVGL